MAHAVSAQLKIPWAQFPSTIPRSSAPISKSAPWKLWRLNMYRYDYGSSPDGCELPVGKFGDSCSKEELSAWSSSGEGDFHMPQNFGSATLLDKQRVSE